MADAHRKAQWDRHGVLLALIANVNRDPKKRPRPFRPSDFNPYAEKPRAMVMEGEGLAAMRAAFTGVKEDQR